MEDWAARPRLRNLEDTVTGGSDPPDIGAGNGQLLEERTRECSPISFDA